MPSGRRFCFSPSPSGLVFTTTPRLLLRAAPTATAAAVSPAPFSAAAVSPAPGSFSFCRGRFPPRRGKGRSVPPGKTASRYLHSPSARPPRAAAAAQAAPLPPRPFPPRRFPPRFLPKLLTISRKRNLGVLAVLGNLLNLRDLRNQGCSISSSPDCVKCCYSGICPARPGTPRHAPARPSRPSPPI